MPPGQQIALQPSLALVLAQHLHHPPIRGQVIVVGIAIRHPGTVGNIEHVLPAVRVVLVRTEEPEVSALQIQSSSRRAGTFP